MNTTLLLEPFSAVLAALMNTMVAAVAVAALTWLALRLLPRVNAATRHAAWWAVLTAVVAITIIPFLPRVSSERVARPAPVAPYSAPVRVANPAAAPRVAAPAAGDTILPAQPVEVESGLWILGVFAVWAIVALWRSARIARSYVMLRRLRRHARLAPPEIASVFDRLRMDCGIRRPARLLVSSDIAAPIAMGFRRPAVILPESMLAEFSPNELDHVLLHELAHVARFDDWTNLVARAANAAIGLHPVFAFVVARIDRERENACDDWVVARTGAARPYAASLTRVFELTHTAKPLLASGMAERGSKLGDRVERLLERGREFSTKVSVETLAVSAAMLMGLTFAAAHSPTWFAFVHDRMPMVSLLPPIEIADGNTGHSLLQLAYFQRPPQPPTAPQAPAAPRAPEAPRVPEPPEPPDFGRFYDFEPGARARLNAEMDAVTAQLRAVEQQLGQARTPELAARSAQLEAQLEALLDAEAGNPFHRRPLLQELIDADMTNLSVEEIIQMAQNGVSPQFLKSLKELGYDKLTRDQIVSLQQSGVSANYLRALKDAGITDLTVNQIIAAAQNGVRAQDIKTARAYKRDMSIDDIVKLKQNGAL